jgi:hypothetical protein
MFDLEQLNHFLRAIAGQTQPLSTMQALTALDHADRLQAEIDRQRAATIATPAGQMIDTHRCVTHDGRHVLADGTVE